MTGIRHKSEFSNDGGGGRRGRGRGWHPSGLSGKQIGLWYARKGHEKKARKELKQVLEPSWNLKKFEKFVSPCISVIMM